MERRKSRRIVMVGVCLGMGAGLASGTVAHGKPPISLPGPKKPDLTRSCEWMANPRIGLPDEGRFRNMRVDPPEPPRKYWKVGIPIPGPGDPPTGGCTVDNTTDLRTVLEMIAAGQDPFTQQGANPSPDWPPLPPDTCDEVPYDGIVRVLLEPGTYECPDAQPWNINGGTNSFRRFLKVPGGVHLHNARSVSGPAVLKFGVQIRGAEAGLHGLTIDIDEVSCAAEPTDHVYQTNGNGFVLDANGNPIPEKPGDRRHAGISVQTDRGFPGTPCEQLEPNQGIDWDRCADQFESNVLIVDTQVNGGGVVSYGIFAKAMSGLRVLRSEINNFRDHGVYTPVTLNPGIARHFEVARGGFIPPVFEDLTVQHIANPDVLDLPCSLIGEDARTQACGDLRPEMADDGVLDAYFPGDREHALTLSTTSVVRRVKIRDIGWGGIVLASNRPRSVPTYYQTSVTQLPLMFPTTLVNSNRSTLEHISVDRLGPYADPEGAEDPDFEGNFFATNVAIAFEKKSEDATLSSFCVGPDTNRGVHHEYHQGPGSHHLRAENTSTRNGIIDSARPVNLFWNASCSWSEIGGECVSSAWEAGIPYTPDMTDLSTNSSNTPRWDQYGSFGVITSVHTEGATVRDVLVRFATAAKFAFNSDNLNLIRLCDVCGSDIWNADNSTPLGTNDFADGYCSPLEPLSNWTPYCVENYDFFSPWFEVEGPNSQGACNYSSYLGSAFWYDVDEGQTPKTIIEARPSICGAQPWTQDLDSSTCGPPPLFP